MQRYQFMFIYGFAIFSMFFGSGNLVFPLQIGQMAGSYWFFGFLGLFITGIVLPFLGLFVIKLYKGNYRSFFNEAGPIAGFILPLFTLSLLGSFAVVPRCITVAHGGINDVIPGLSLTIFSLIFSSACFIFCLKDRLMIIILGKWMTPFLLISLLILMIMGIANAPIIADHPDQLANSVSVFSDGFMTGYQTMDLFAAFFFSALIFNQIQERITRESSGVIWHTKDIIRIALKPSLIGASLLAFVYLGFVYLGAHFKLAIQDVSPELFLPTIATHIMGSWAAFLIGVIVVLSCLTTAVALNNIYARYLCSLCKFDNKRFPLVLAATTLTSFSFSLLDFKGIAAFLAPTLEFSYPSIILLTVLCIVVKDRYKMIKIVLFYAVLGMMLLGTSWG